MSPTNYQVRFQDYSYTSGRNKTSYFRSPQTDSEDCTTPFYVLNIKTNHVARFSERPRGLRLIGQPCLGFAHGVVIKNAHESYHHPVWVIGDIQPTSSFEISVIDLVNFKCSKFLSSEILWIPDYDNKNGLYSTILTGGPDTDSKFGTVITQLGRSLTETEACCKTSEEIKKLGERLKDCAKLDFLTTHLLACEKRKIPTEMVVRDCKKLKSLTHRRLGQAPPTYPASQVVAVTYKNRQEQADRGFAHARMRTSQLTDRCEMRHALKARLGHRLAVVEEHLSKRRLDEMSPSYGTPTDSPPVVPEVFDMSSDEDESSDTTTEDGMFSDISVSVLGDGSSDTLFDSLTWDGESCQMPAELDSWPDMVEEFQLGPAIDHLTHGTDDLPNTMIETLLMDLERVEPCLPSPSEDSWKTVVYERLQSPGLQDSWEF